MLTLSGGRSPLLDLRGDGPSRQILSSTTILRPIGTRHSVALERTRCFPVDLEFSQCKVGPGVASYSPDLIHDHGH
jgi:hypothetical protein